MPSVLLIALGMMGQRYQQTLVNLYGEELTLVTVDPKHATGSTANHFADLSEVPSDIVFDLAIDARPNLKRAGLLEALLTRKIPRIVIEKPPANSVQEALSMQKLLEEADYSPRIFVPFYRRFTEAFQPQTLSQLNAGKLKSVTIAVGAVGLGCVGVHYIDLANFLFDAVPTQVYGQLQVGTIPSPRGEQFSDDAGTIIVNYPEGDLILHMRDDSSSGACITLTYERGKIQCMDQVPYQWHWFCQPAEKQQEPFYKTHQEISVAPPCEYRFDLLSAMRAGIEATMDAQAVIPGFAEGWQTLKILALATASSEQHRPLAWTDDAAIADVTFQFT